MQKIDSHVHFWNYDPVRNSWISADMALLKKDFLPRDFQPLIRRHEMDGCVLVQVNQTESENDFFLKLASEHNFVKGIVGWVDLCAENISERLAYYQRSGKIRGFRHMLQDEADRSYMLRPDFRRGVGFLAAFGFTYDLLILPDQLAYSARLVKEFPDQLFIIDHLAKPGIRVQELETWKKGIVEISGMEQVYCKLSGLVNEAHWKNWTKQMFTPYLDVIVESFGANRILFGSDWPVCLLSASYEDVLGIAEDYFSSFSKTEQEKIMGGNAVAFYGL
jgi:L-fuconolactonase